MPGLDLPSLVLWWLHPGDRRNRWVRGEYAEREWRCLVMRGGHHTRVHGSAAESYGAGRGRQRPPGGLPGLDSAGDLDERCRGSDLVRQLLRAARPRGDLQHPGNSLLAGRSPGRDATPGEQRLSHRAIQGAADSETSKKRHGRSRTVTCPSLRYMLPQPGRQCQQPPGPHLARLPRIWTACPSIRRLPLPILAHACSWLHTISWAQLSTTTTREPKPSGILSQRQDADFREQQEGTTEVGTPHADRPEPRERSPGLPTTLQQSPNPTDGEPPRQGRCGISKGEPPLPVIALPHAPDQQVPTAWRPESAAPCAPQPGLHRGACR